MADATSRQQLREAVDAYKKSGKNDILTYPEGEPDAVTITDSDMDGLQPGEYLSDNIIDFYIKYLQKTRLPSTDRGRFYFFNSFFFRKLLKNSSASTGSDECGVDFGQLRKWTQGVDLFEKEYIFIPVIHRSHWSLILICHLTSMKQSRESKPPPCIYHLDSISGRHESFKNQMKSYLFEAWMDGRDVINKDQFDQMRALTCMRYVETKVQQDNKHDCGVYLLQSVENILDTLVASKEFRWELNRLETCFVKWNPSEVYEKRMSIRMLILEMSGVQEIRLYLKPCKSQGISKQCNGDLEQKGIAYAHKLMKTMKPVMEEFEGVVEVEAQRDIEMERGEHYNNGEMELDLLNSHPKDDTKIEHVEHGRDKELDLRRSCVRIEDLHHSTTSADALNSKDDEQLHDIVSPQSHVNGNGRAWKWTGEATEVLLECMVKGNMFHKESKRATNWNRISLEIMNRSGERPSDKQCRLRYDTLLKAYKVMNAFCKKNVKSFGEITNMERKELRLSTTLCEEWYNMIEKISNNARHDQKPLKRRKLSPSIENGPPFEMERVTRLITPIVPDNIVDDQQTLEHHAIIASELLRSSEARMHDCEEGRFRLRFKNKLAQPIFAQDVLTSEKCNKLIVNLEDVDSGEIVTTGPWASAELEVVVLSLGLASDVDGNWTLEESENHIWCGVLFGELDIKLMDGEGLLGEVWFDYTTPIIVKLGVRVCPRSCVGFRIQEAKSEAFEVIPQHWKKLCPLTLGSEVWTLQNIYKWGSFHKAFIEMGIFTVEEFLRQEAMGIFTVEEFLRQKAMGIVVPCFIGKSFDLKGTLEHAMTCKPSGKIRRYEQDGRCIVFNHLFQAIGLMVENGPFRDAQSLSYIEKILMEKLIQKALRSWKHVELDEELIVTKMATER